MPGLRHCGFFHLDPRHKNDPVDLLEDALRKSGQQALFGESLVVLPEALNIAEDYYYRTYVLAKDIEKRLITLSTRLGLCFVVGLIREDATPYSEAILIDGAFRRQVLSRKTLCDGSPCYAPFTQSPEDDIIFHRNLRIGALICMDAAEGDDRDARQEQQTRHAAIVAEFRKYAEPAILCVPARFGASSPVEVAKTWNQRKVSVVIANCGIAFQYPSILHFENGQTCAAPTDGDCHVHIAALPTAKCES